MRVVMLRVFLFFLQATALMALLPLVARGCTAAGRHLHADAVVRGRRRHRGGAALPALARSASTATSSCVGTLVHAALSALIVLVPELWVAVPAMAWSAWPGSRWPIR
jgi:hypothetical protein